MGSLSRALWGLCTVHNQAMRIEGLRFRVQGQGLLGQYSMLEGFLIMLT